MKIPLNIVLGLLLFGSMQPERSAPRVGAASQEPSATADTQAQQREREEYVKSIQAKLDDYDKKLDGLEDRLSTLSGTDQDDFKKTIQQLRDKKKAIASQLNNAKNASPGAWGVIKTDADSAVGKLERSYQDVSRKIQWTPAAPSKNQEKSPEQKSPEQKSPER